MTKSLVIVESPSKAKTIQKYLGQGYTVLASGGHVCDLPQKTLGIDVEHGFEPEYEINPEKVPLPVRRAFVAALNRDQLLKLRYEKLGWKETLPGSMCMLPMQEGYQDNYPTKLGKDVATKILEDAGYTKSPTRSSPSVATRLSAPPRSSWYSR